MTRLPSVAALLGALVALLGVGCSTYPYAQACPPGYSCTPVYGGGPGYPASCPAGYSCTPGTPSGGGWVPPAGSRFHTVWRDGSGLHVQLATREFVAWGNGSGAGTVTVDSQSWVPRLQSDAPSIGWKIADGRRMRFTAQTLRLDLDAPDGLADGSKLNVSYEHFGAVAWHRTVDSQTGPGVNIVANSDGSAAFIAQASKTW